MSLFAVQSIPYNRIAEMMRDMFGLDSFSEGTVKNILSRNKAKAQAVYMALLSYYQEPAVLERHQYVSEMVQ